MDILQQITLHLYCGFVLKQLLPSIHAADL